MLKAIKLDDGKYFYTGGSFNKVVEDVFFNFSTPEEITEVSGGSFAVGGIGYSRDRHEEDMECIFTTLSVPYFSPNEKEMTDEELEAEEDLYEQMSESEQEAFDAAISAKDAECAKHQSTLCCVTNHTLTLRMNEIVASRSECKRFVVSLLMAYDCEIPESLSQVMPAEFNKDRAAQGRFAFSIFAKLEEFIKEKETGARMPKIKNDSFKV